MVARLLSLLFLIGTVQGQALYCGLDNGLSSKVTLSNLVTYSEQIDNAAWTKTRTTVSANSITAPDGALTADTIVATATTNSFYVGSASISTTAGDIRRVSAYFKAGTMRYAALNPGGDAVSRGIVVNLSTGEVVYSFGANSYSVTSVGNNWYRIIFEYTRTNTGNEVLYLTLSNGDASLYPSFAATTADYVYVWGIHSQLASSPSDYLATTSAAATLGPLCGSYQTQSPLDPSQCITMTNRGREIRTEAQIAIGSQ
jgi:hypothetical protein